MHGGLKFKTQMKQNSLSSNRLKEMEVEKES